MKTLRNESIETTISLLEMEIEKTKELQNNNDEDYYYHQGRIRGIEHSIKLLRLMERDITERIIRQLNK